MQDKNKNTPKADDLDEIRMLLGEDPEELSADRLSLDDILAEFGTEGLSSPPDTDSDAQTQGGIPLSDPPAEDAAAEDGQEREIYDAHTGEPIALTADETDAAARTNRETELARRREELKRAYQKNNALQDEIASYVDAAMDEKKGGIGEKTAKLPHPSRAIPPLAPQERAAQAESPRQTGEVSAQTPAQEDDPSRTSSRSNRVSLDLRAFRSLRPDEAAVKAKRAVGYYSWCGMSVLALAVLSWYMTAAPTYKLWLPGFLTYSERPYITLLVLVVFQCAAMFIARSFIADGLRSLFKFDFKAETLLSFSSILTLLYTISIIIFPQWGGYLPCVPCAMFGLFVGLFARRQRYKSIRGCCRAASRAEGSYCTIKGMRDHAGNVKTVYKTQPSRLKPEFMESILEEDPGEGLMRYFAPIALIVTLLFSLISSVGTGHASYFLWHWSTLLCIAAPAGIILSQVVPFAAVSNKLSHIGVALMGTKGIDDIADTESAILGETDIFPTKMITVNGVKVFSGFTKEKVNLCTLSVLKASGSHLYHSFAASLPGQPMNLPAVEGFEFYETGGMGAYVNGEKVLVGTANFILRMAVKVPEGINLKNGVLVAINMQFAGIFSIKYDIQPSVRRSLNFMIKHKITPVMAVRDFNMTPQLIESRFKVNPDHFDYPDLEQRIAYSAIRDSEMDDDCAVVAVNNLHSYGEAVSCGKRVKNAIKLNTVFGYLSACLGVPLIFYLLFMQSYTVVTPANIFYYLLLFFVPTLISAFGANRR